MAIRVSLVGTRTAGATGTRPPLRRDERNPALDTKAPRVAALRARAGLAWFRRERDPTTRDLHRDTRLGILTIFAPVGLISTEHARVWTTATILPSRLTMA